MHSLRRSKSTPAIGKCGLGFFSDLEIWSYSLPRPFLNEVIDFFPPLPLVEVLVCRTSAPPAPDRPWSFPPWGLPGAVQFLENLFFEGLLPGESACICWADGAGQPVFEPNGLFLIGFVAVIGGTDRPNPHLIADPVVKGSTVEPANVRNIIAHCSRSRPGR